VALSSGTRLGPYEILEPLGAGGMGEVYRGRDTRLGREVAIKVLPPDRLSDPSRRARFVQEARAASALNHPHIVTIHEIESAEGRDFIVMELVPGKTLDALIPRPGMRLGEALRIAIPLADALAAAHAAGIVHRDLKPANVMVTPEGVVKVLDFGLAKLTQAEGASSEDATTVDAQAKLSRPGTVAGTPAYMSPEQAAGGTVDARSDIFSFGAVLYEMVTGRRAFSGTSSAETLAAVLKEQPKAPSEVVPEVPRDLERIILHCLRKEPERRFQHATDLKVELQEVKEESDSQAEAPAGAGTASHRRRRRWIAGAVGVLILATAVTAALWRLRGPEPPPPTVLPLTSERLARGGSFSPDGTQIAFSSLGEREDNRDIRLKIVGQAEARRLTTDPAADLSPAWSPDGTQIAFLRSDPEVGHARIYLVSPLGGPERRLSEFPAWTQLSWSPDGRWVAAAKARSGSDPPGGIHLIPVAGGEPRAVTFPKPGAWDVSPSFSPDGRALAYISCEGVLGGGNANSVCDIHVSPLDSDLRPHGAARPLTRQRLPMIGLDWTRDGRSIIYGAGGAGGSYLWRVRVDGGATPERLEPAGRGAGTPATARSQDRLVFTRNVWDPDIYRLHLGGSPTPLLVSSFIEVFPQYSPDGRRIVFESGRAGGVEEIWLAEADGSNPVRLTRGPGRYQGSPRWSPDGRSIAFDSYGENGHSDIWTIGVEGSGLRQVTRDPADDTVPSWSRDGRFIYFASNRTGRNEIWRVPVRGGAEEQLTREGGNVPFESLDGRTLYYLRRGALLARRSTGGPERTIVGCVNGGNYAVAPRGLFYVACETEAGTTGAIWILRFRDAASGEDLPVATLEADWLGGVSISSDGQSIVYARTKRTSDVLTIENFR
jgi:Tol biopolymer transport system component/serine/threonine protein kinase